MAPMRHRTDTAWTLEDVAECFHPGERWAYRTPGRRDFREAEIHSIVPKSKPPRLKVILYDDGFEVKREVVPPGRLWAPWSQVEELRAEEARWARVRAVKPPHHEASAAFWALIDERPGVFDYFDETSGVGLVLDAPALAAELRLTVEDMHDPSGFTDAEGSVVGWAVTRRLAQAALLADNAARARDLARRINAARGERAEVVEERLRLKQWDADLIYLPLDHRAFDLTVEWADDLEHGLRSLVPDFLDTQEQEDARLLLLEAIDVISRVRPELERPHAPKRHAELLEKLDALTRRAARVGLRQVAFDEPAHDLPTSERE